MPVFAVLGNHDFHAGRSDELTAIVEAAGVHVLDRSWRTCEIDGLELGIVGAKGFIGGFPGSALPDFGEPLMREVYAETTHEAECDREGPAGDRALRPPDRAPALRADPGDASRASRRAST